MHHLWLLWLVHSWVAAASSDELAQLPFSVWPELMRQVAASYSLLLLLLLFLRLRLSSTSSLWYRRYACSDFSGVTDPDYPAEVFVWLWRRYLWVASGPFIPRIVPRSALYRQSLGSSSARKWFGAAKLLWPALKVKGFWIIWTLLDWNVASLRTDWDSSSAELPSFLVRAKRWYADYWLYDRFQATSSTVDGYTERCLRILRTKPQRTRSKFLESSQSVIPEKIADLCSCSELLILLASSSSGSLVREREHWWYLVWSKELTIFTYTKPGFRWSTEILPQVRAQAWWLPGG